MHFDLGTLEISPAAREFLSQRRIAPSTFFERHRAGEWGPVQEGCATANDLSARKGHPHAIRSRHVLPGGIEVLVVTSVNRSRTRLQLLDEYPTLEVSAAEGYALWAQEYDLKRPLAACEETVVLPIFRDLPALRDVIDVGTGTGRHALTLSRSAARVVALDASAEMLAVARDNIEREGRTNIKLVRAVLDANGLPLESGVFDLLITALMLTHLEDLGAAARECVRLVRPGGTVIVTDFHPAARWFRWRTAFATPDAWYNLPNAGHSREDYLSAFEQTGCKLTEVHDVAGDGTPYGDVSQKAVLERGVPPNILAFVARKVTIP